MSCDLLPSPNHLTLTPTPSKGQIPAHYTPSTFIPMSGLSKRKVAYLYDRKSFHCFYRLILKSICSGCWCIHLWTRPSHEASPNAYDARVGHSVRDVGENACTGERIAKVIPTLADTFSETKTRKPGGDDYVSHRRIHPFPIQCYPGDSRQNAVSKGAMYVSLFIRAKGASNA